MNRRGFLASLAGLAGGLVLPDREVRRVYSFLPAIWTPSSIIGTRGPLLISPRIAADVLTITTPEEWRHYFGTPPPRGLFDPPKFIPITFPWRKT